ncbi:MAG: hypothetical protein Q4C91_13895 [Eubacteriales bacterium]|nr:hypothetical protein [Eubacteriales bacterium]
MSSLFGDIQPAVKKETKRVCISTAAGVVLMWIAFAVLHFAMPQQVPFDYTVILGGIGGAAIAVLNFFLMGLTVQKVAASTDEDAARSRMKASYSQRMLLQMLWVVVAIVAPCFQFAAGILPLLFPSIGIKLMGIMNKCN